MHPPPPPSELETIPGLHQIKIQVSQSAGFGGTQCPYETPSSETPYPRGWRMVTLDLQRFEKGDTFKSTSAKSCLKFCSPFTLLSTKKGYSVFKGWGTTIVKGSSKAELPHPTFGMCWCMQVQGTKRLPLMQMSQLVTPLLLEQPWDLIDGPSNLRSIA